MNLPALVDRLAHVLQSRLPVVVPGKRPPSICLQFDKQADATAFAAALDPTFRGLRDPLPPATLGKPVTWFREVGHAIVDVAEAATDPFAHEAFSRFLSERWLAGEPVWYDGSAGPNYFMPEVQDCRFVPEISLRLRAYDPAWLTPLRTAAACTGTPNRPAPVGMKEPPPKAFQAYKAVRLTGLKQKDVGDKLQVPQGTVSRWVDSVARWLEAGNIAPDILDGPRGKPTPMDPRKIDIGRPADKRKPRHSSRDK